MTLVLNSCIGLLIIAALISIIRMIKGPTVFDRLVSFDGLAVSIVSVMVLLSIVWETGVYIDIILVFSLFGFLGTIAFCFYLAQNMEPEDNS